MVSAEHVGQQFETHYHLTDNANFRLNPNKVPQDNAVAINSRTRPGLFTGDPERWINGHNYMRPFVAEVQVPKGAAEDGRWGGEKFIPGDRLKEATVSRVIPTDAYARETYGDHGWAEEALGNRFDTHEPIQRRTTNQAPFSGYHYDGPDAREMSPAQVKEHKARTRKAAKVRAS
jgi:hypothetical protein